MTITMKKTLRFTLALCMLSRCQARPDLSRPPAQILRDWDTNFGDSMAIHRGTAVIGASLKNGRGSFTIYEEDPAAQDKLWVKKQVVKFEPNLPGYGRSEGSTLGASVGIYGDVVLAGAPNLDLGGPFKPDGAVYLFRRNSATGLFEFVSQIQSPLPLSQHGHFGYSVDIGKDRFVIGEREADDPNNYVSVGAAHVYTYSLTSDGSVAFNHVQTIFPPNPHTNAYFATSLDMAGDTLVVGEEGRNYGGQLETVFQVGQAYIYLWSGSQFVLESERFLTPGTARPEQFFGCSIAISADETTVAVGANGDSVNDAYVGQAFVFDLTQGQPTRTSLIPVTGDIIARDLYGSSVAITSDGSYIYVGAPGIGPIAGAGGPGQEGNGRMFEFHKSGTTLALGQGFDDYGHALALSEDDHYLFLSDVAPKDYMENIYIWTSRNPPTPAPATPSPVSPPTPSPVSSPPTSIGGPPVTPVPTAAPTQTPILPVTSSPTPPVISTLTPTVPSSTTVPTTPILVTLTPTAPQTTGTTAPTTPILLTLTPTLPGTPTTAVPTFPGTPTIPTTAAPTTLSTPTPPGTTAAPTTLATPTPPGTTAAPTTLVTPTPPGTTAAPTTPTPPGTTAAPTPGATTAAPTPVTTAVSTPGATTAAPTPVPTSDVTSPPTPPTPLPTPFPTFGGSPTGTTVQTIIQTVAPSPGPTLPLVQGLEKNISNANGSWSRLNAFGWARVSAILCLMYVA